jgi:L-cystine transport system permease protein
MQKLFDVENFYKCLPEILGRLPLTFSIAIIAFIIGIIIGFFVALVRIYKVPVLNLICRFYVSFIRGTPLVIQLFLANYGIARIIYYLQTTTERFADLSANAISAEALGLIAFSVNLGAYTSETIRSAIESVPNGQFEAAKSVGMTTGQMMIRIIIPQAIRSAVPNLNNVMINTMKDTSLLFTIGIIDMMGQAKIFGARTMKLIEVYVAVALIYWIICIVMTRIFAVIEKKSKVYNKVITQ